MEIILHAFEAENRKVRSYQKEVFNTSEEARELRNKMENKLFLGK